MALVPLLVVALLLGRLSGGTFAQLRTLRIHGEATILALYIAQAVARQLGPWLGASRSQLVVWMWVAVTVGLVVVTLRNARVPGMLVLAAGLALNLVVVSLNAGMPVEGLTRQDAFHVAVNQETRLASLGDVVPVRGPGGLRLLVSWGDIVMMAGAATIVIAGMHRRPESSNRRDMNVQSPG